MPLYDYRCNDCGNEERDAIVKLSDRDSRECPRCEHRPVMERLMGLPARGVIAGGGAADLAGRRPRRPSSRGFGDIPTAGRDGSIYSGGRKVINADGSKA
jgi:putative FmdB family regulatory protein